MLGEFEFKGRVTALMLAEFFSCEPDGRQPITGPNDKEDTLALPCLGHRDITRVPGDVGLIGHG